MTMNFKMVALAALAALTGAAQAATTNSTEALGNSSLLFVAVDVNSNTGLVVDLGLSMSDFTNVTSANLPQGSWNFATDSTSFATTGNSWSAAYNTFKSTQSGGDFLWGVVAGDSVTGAAVSGTNAIVGRGVLATGNPTVANMTAVVTAGSTGNALGNFSNFVASARNLGTLTSAENGAAATTSTSGSAWLPTLMGDKFGGQLTWSYLLANGALSSFQWQQNTVANPVVNQFGALTTTDSQSPSPLSFSFDVATDTLTASVPVPEPSTYALMFAGLVAVCFMARRRQA